MKKRGLSLLLALVLVLGLVPVGASADEVPSVTVYVSLSHDDQFMVGAESNQVMALVPITVPYFDIGEETYGLQDYYFQNENYGSDGGDHSSDLEPGSKEYAYGKITLLHVYLYATEIFYCGLDKAEAGQGYLRNAGLLSSGDYKNEECALFLSGTVGSTFMNRFWDYDSNLNYYENYEYPLASEAWGATCDQMLVKDNDIITVGHFTAGDFYFDMDYATMNYITAEEEGITKNHTVTAGEQVDLWVKRSWSNLMEPAGTFHNFVTTEPDVYACMVREAGDTSSWSVYDADVTSWPIELGAADASGMIAVDTTDWEPGTYIIAIAGQPNAYGNISSTPGGMLLTVLGDEPEAPQPPAVEVDTSKLGELLPKENITIADGTMTIAPAANTPACMVLVKNGDEYTRVAATKNEDNTYNFDVSNLPEGASIVVAVKGDVSGDGKITLADYSQIAKSLLPTDHDLYKAITELNSKIGDASGDGKITLADYSLIAKSLLPAGHDLHKAISW